MNQALALVPQHRSAPAVAFEQQCRLAESFARSGLFGIKTPDQALALMALCEAEGLHPAIAVRDYHIIQGKPALKADAMLARFQAAGGRVRWTAMTDERVAAEFSHPSGGTVEIDWDKQRAITAGFWGKDNWKKFPRPMLRARVISEGIRTVFPGVVVGVYTPEEVQDFDARPHAPEPASAPAEAPEEERGDLDALIDKFADAIVVIKESLASNDLYKAAETWFALDEQTQRGLWVAPSKGGPFTTEERKTIKTPEFRRAYFGDDK